MVTLKELLDLMLTVNQLTGRYDACLSVGISHKAREYKGVVTST